MLGIRPQIWLLCGLGVAVLAAVVWGSARSPEPSHRGAVEPAGPAAAAARAGAVRPGPSEALAPPRAAPAAPRTPGSEASARARRDAPSAAEARSDAGREPTWVLRDTTPEWIALEERASDRARELGLELPPSVRDAIRAQEPLPGEDEPAFADRLRDLERQAFGDELLVEDLVRQRYRSEIFRVGEPTSQHRAEAAERVAAMTPEERAEALDHALRRVDSLAEPRFWPPEFAVPFEGPDAEPLPPDYRWVEPELLQPLY